MQDEEKKGVPEVNNSSPTIVQTDVGAKDGQEKCPKCGSTNIGYFTGLVNFVEAMRGGSAHYKQTATCLNCHFQVESEIDDNDNNYLKQMELIKKNP